MGGYGVFFRDHRDTIEGIPGNEDQTNNQGELRATLYSLQERKNGHRSLICPDLLLVVNGVLSWAQRWRRHKWYNIAGAVKHVDPWTQILDIIEQLGDSGIHGREWPDFPCMSILISEYFYIWVVTAPSSPLHLR